MVTRSCLKAENQTRPWTAVRRRRAHRVLLFASLILLTAPRPALVRADTAPKKRCGTGRGEAAACSTACPGASRQPAVPVVDSRTQRTHPVFPVPVRPCCFFPRAPARSVLSGVSVAARASSPLPPAIARTHAHVSASSAPHSCFLSLKRPASCFWSVPSRRPSRPSRRGGLGLATTTSSVCLLDTSASFACVDAT